MRFQREKAALLTEWLVWRASKLIEILWHRILRSGQELALWEQLNNGRELLLVACLTCQHHASVSQGRICTDKFTCSHTEIEAADHTFYLTQSLYTDTGPTSPSADPITLGAWQGSHWSANF